jgi:Tfp pilus assembly protein PilO
MRYIFLLLLIVASVGVFIAVIIPRYHDVQTMRTNVASYQANLATALKLQQSRQALIAQYNTISKTDLDNITTLLPDSVDNIRLIIQINSLATKDGLASVSAVDYDPTQAPATAGGAATTTTPAPTTTDPTTDNLPYGNFVISFQTTGQYSNFLSFLSDLEQNLRLVDITDIDFTPITNPTTGATSVASGITYKVTLQTYWLK